MTTSDGSGDSPRDSDRVADLMEQAAGKMRLAAKLAHENGDEWDGGLMSTSVHIRGMAMGRRGIEFSIEVVESAD